MNTKQSFKLTTLRDIFNLPTIEQMKTCLAEMSEGMIQARIANDAMVATMKEHGIAALRAVEWPEVATWVDDGEGKVRTTFGTDPKNPMIILESKMPVNGGAQHN